jgi:hypothetical protein
MDRFVTLAALAASLGMAWATPSFAYRPFDGTDAAVADRGEMEIELQPAGAQRDQTGTKLVAPAVVVNYGLMQDWEAVLEGRLETPVSPGGPSSLSGSAFSLKHVILPGSLQEKAGPSIAAEFAVLLPDTNNPGSGYGASIASIISQRFNWGTIHLNGEAALTRDHDADVFADMILEGPSRWKVRPVAEFFYEDQFGRAQTVSGLVGVIWQARENLAFDFAVREALTKKPVSEIRAGVTFGFPVLSLARAGHR